MIGAFIGDVVGSRFEFNNIKRKDFKLFNKASRPTDDSIMTAAVLECCIYKYDTEAIIDCFKEWGRRHPNAGYGGRFYYWVLGDNRESYYSCGNGSAMRISAVGWFANSENEVKALSKKVTEVTHNHPEGLKGAEVVAMCIYYARIGKSKDFIKDYIISEYPEVSKLDYNKLVRDYYHGQEICQDSVPQALYCFLISNDFEDCLRTTISIGGDCDTTAAMSCAIAEAFYGYIPSNIIENTLNILPNDIKRLLNIYKNAFVDNKSSID